MAKQSSINEYSKFGQQTSHDDLCKIDMTAYYIYDIDMVEHCKRIFFA